MVVAIGDERTYDDVLRALPADGISVAVGRDPSTARFRLGDHRAVRCLLRSLVEPKFMESLTGRFADDHAAIA